MTEPIPLRLVKTGAPEVDVELAEAAEAAAQQIVEVVKAGGGFWLLLDGEEQQVSYVGDLLDLSVCAEEVARRMKLAAVGLDE
jgi:hypothetical protein